MQTPTYVPRLDNDPDFVGNLPKADSRSTCWIVEDGGKRLVSLKVGTMSDNQTHQMESMCPMKTWMCRTIVNHSPWMLVGDNPVDTQLRDQVNRLMRESVRLSKHIFFRPNRFPGYLMDYVLLPQRTDDLTLTS